MLVNLEGYVKLIYNYSRYGTECQFSTWPASLIAFDC